MSKVDQIILATISIGGWVLLLGIFAALMPCN
jgi:hypothetical protein